MTGRSRGRAGAEAPPPRELLRFVARFDRREFWLAHEELEDLWQVDKRDFFKGLIQLAAAFLHIERENWNGARRLLRTSLEYLEAAPSSYEGFDVDAVRHRAAAAREHVEALAERREHDFPEELFFSLAAYFDAKIDPTTVDGERLPYRVRRYDEGYRPIRRRNRG